MCFFFSIKKRLLFWELAKAFPKEYRADVEAVCRALPVVKSVAYGGALCSEGEKEWRLLSGEKIVMPYRIYVQDTLIFPNGLTSRQKLIYHCIFSRSYDGYVRQRHVEALLDATPPEWAMPYIIKLCDEYVKEILEVVYQKLKGNDCRQYKALCERNFDEFKRGHSRMINYWSVFYRYDCYNYKEYIGKKLYQECFGYRKTGQKNIEY